MNLRILNGQPRDYYENKNNIENFNINENNILHNSNKVNFNIKVLIKIIIFRLMEFKQTDFNRIVRILLR